MKRTDYSISSSHATLRQDAKTIYEKAIRAVFPDEAVVKALNSKEFNAFMNLNDLDRLYDSDDVFAEEISYGADVSICSDTTSFNRISDSNQNRDDKSADGARSVFVLSFGKAAWQMAKAAHSVLSSKMIRSTGIVITKYDHVKGDIPGLTCYEAGHPVPDENSFKATEETISMLRSLQASDRVLLLISGGGSALLEKPLISGDELKDITSQLLASGADIKEINTIRKRLSAVKGGRLAEICAPAKVFSVVLSDILGDPLDMIASGPAYPDSSTSDNAKDIVNKYNISLSSEAVRFLEQETPKKLDNVTTMITGSVRELVSAASDAARELGYEARILTDKLEIEAKDAGRWLAEEALKVSRELHEACSCAPEMKNNTTGYKAMSQAESLTAVFDGGPDMTYDTPRVGSKNANTKIALIAGGETVVRLTGTGKGGRNQELALSAAQMIAGQDNIVVFSIGSDGTDGPTDAAGGITDGTTYKKLQDIGIEISDVLFNNDAYNALVRTDDLIITGPTGTNVNDLCCALISFE